MRAGRASLVVLGLAAVLAIVLAVLLMTSGTAPQVGGIADRIAPGGASDPADGTHSDGASALARVPAPRRVGASHGRLRPERLVTWRLRFEPTFARRDASFERPQVLHAAVILDGGERRDVPLVRLERAAPVELDVQLEDEDVDRASLAVSTSPLGLQAGDGRVFFGLVSERRGGARLADGRRDAGTRDIDLGVVDLQPPRPLGRVRFDRDTTSALSVFVGTGSPPPHFALQFEKRGLGRLAQPPVGTREIECSAFTAPRSWFAIVKSPSGAVLFQDSARAGADLHIVLPEETGIRVSIDLVRHPRAFRVVVVRGDEAHLSTIDEPAFDERVRAALTTAVLPMPDRRKGRDEIDIGVLDVPPCFARVELWSLRGGDGKRELLASQPVVVDGPVEEVRL